MRAISLVGVAAALFLTVGALAQKAKPKMERMEAKTATVCYGLNKDSFTEIGPPAEYLAWKKNPGARTQTADIQVEYVGFTAQAQAAFQAAVDIWKTAIQTNVTIRIRAQWKVLGTGVLGSASPATYYRNFSGAQKDDIWYPVALAEKITNQQLNGSTEPDIVASFNSAQSAWYYGTTGATPAGKYDLVSVVLHEIGHGLGITHSLDDQGQLALGLPVIYETFLQGNGSQNLVEAFAEGSTALKNQVVSNKLFFNSPLVRAINPSFISIYAPITYSAGSSIAHLDEDTYPAGNKNSLMTPFFNSAEKNHSPGPLTMALLKDLGWSRVLMNHTPKKNTENVTTNYAINTVVASDTAYDHSSIKLLYSYDGTNFTTVGLSESNTNANSFSGSIPTPPNPSQVTNISYFLSATDVAARDFTNPGKEWTQGSASHPNFIYQFQAGPDSQPPRITHTPVRVVKETDTQLDLSAYLADNIGIRDAKILYSINQTTQPDANFNKAGSLADSTFVGTITFNVQAGDTIYYRIFARDSSVAINTTTSPIYKVAVMPIIKKYQNDFNTTSNDFVGDSFFNISTPSGFSNPSINSIHPYLASDPIDSISYSYILKFPVKIAGPGFASLKYDEIVLVEPGAAGSTWPDPANFYDYVIVEGSRDNVHWLKLINGYDCRDQSVWNTKWSSSSDAKGNSLAVGDPSLYKTRLIDMLATGVFQTGESIFIRFRLMSDQLSAGWGWSIDNLKIQIDETPPTILHNPVDFVYYKAPSFDLAVKPSDISGVKTLSIDYKINNNDATLTTINLPIQQNVNQYTATLQLTGSNLSEPDEIEYRINAADSVGNSASLPATGFYKIAVLNFKNGVKIYTSDFNTATTDFVGNFFSVTKPLSGFNTPAIHSAHPYANGFGLDNTSNFSFLLKKPIVVSDNNPKIFFREIVIAEYNGAAVKDYVVVEGSKDKGATWHSLVSPYSSNTIAVWQNAFNAKSNGAESMYKNRLIDITENGDFVAGDSVVVRFRLFADAQNNGWGWSVDDLSIQGTVTAVEDLQQVVALYPNPVSSDYVNLSLPSGTKTSSFEMVNSMGQLVSANNLDVEAAHPQIFVGNLQGGVYLIRLNVDQQVVTKKIIVSR